MDFIKGSNWTGKQLEQDYVKDGFDCLFIQLNVANSDSVKSMVEQVIEKYGKMRLTQYERDGQNCRGTGNSSHQIWHEL